MSSRDEKIGAMIKALATPLPYLEKMRNDLVEKLEMIKMGRKVAPTILAYPNFNIDKLITTVDECIAKIKSSEERFVESDSEISDEELSQLFDNIITNKVLLVNALEMGYGACVEFFKSVYDEITAKEKRQEVTMKELINLQNKSN